MAPKRKKKVTNSSNKKPSASSLLEDYAADNFNKDLKYSLFDFNLAQDSSNIDTKASILLFDLPFKIFSFDYSIDFTQNIVSGLYINSNEDLYLLIICGDTQKFLKLQFIYDIDSNHDFEKWLTLFKPLKSKSTFMVYGCIKHQDSDFYLHLNIRLSKSLIIETYQDLRILKKSDFIMQIMHFVHDYPYYINPREIRDNTSIDEFYSLVFNCQKKQQHEIETITLSKLDSLIPTLRPYQELAVKWMLNRETSNKIYDHQILFDKHSFEGVELYYFKTMGHFVTSQVYEQYISTFPISHGGILADEMGLGKTVETLALILYNQKKNVQVELDFFSKYSLFAASDNPLYGVLQCDCGNVDSTSIIENMSLNFLVESCKVKKYHLNENLIKCLNCANYQHLECSQFKIDECDYPYLCSRCWTKIEPIGSGATLIVSPTSICHQWIDEIHKHLTNVKVLKYNGIKSKEYISPPDLAKYDIVITTYDILKSELPYCSQYDYGQLRNVKRYFPPISPLLCLQWFRLCFDEAQFLEGTYTQAAQMANMLKSTYRWAVTGTPIQKSVKDLYGLFYFIQEEPFCYQQIWNNALYFAYCLGDNNPLLNAVTKCFWRTPKNVVINELGLSEPIYHIKDLEFSQIERDFYLRQVYKCKDKLDLVLKNVDMLSKLSDLSTHNQYILLDLAVKLRQSCCHPMVTSSNQSVKQFHSLSDVLDKMIEDAKYDCEKAHREKISAMNGRSGALLQKLDIKMAIDTYKEALNSISKHEQDFRTDKTQQYHIYYNLAEIVELLGCTQVDCENVHFPAFNGTQLLKKDINTDTIAQQFIFQDEDRQLRIKAKQIYDNYLTTEKLSAITTEKYRLELIHKNDEMKQSFTYKGKWYIAALQQLNFLSFEEIDNILGYTQLFNGSNDFYSKNASVDAIKITLDLNLNSLEDARKDMIETYSPLLEKALAEVKVDQYINCHVKKTNERKVKKCPLCIAELKTIEYERYLFNMQCVALDSAKDKDEVDLNQRVGNWNESCSIAVLRKLGHLYKTRAYNSTDYHSLVEDIDAFMKYIDEIKKEYRSFRKFWTSLGEFILRLDELNQAQTRYIVTIDNKIITNVEQHNEAAIEDAIAQFLVDQNLGEKKLTSNLDRLRYLKNLKNSLQNKDAINSRMCSICWSDLEQYFILTCGHFFCTECLMQLERHYPSSSIIKCSVCRGKCRKDSLCAISTNHEYREKIEGEWSTKIVNIILTCKKILESKEKILIFSSWIRMLELMKSALEQNKIESCLITQSDRNFVSKIKMFQNSSKTLDVLLLPTNFACNGLNLIEASHVIFINPSLNKADEAQAIGRIYRIGQTRQTHIYKFPIKDSIENLIENYHQTIYQPQKGERSEFNNLTLLEFFHFFDT